MIAVRIECPHCWTIHTVRNDQDLVRCRVCRTFLYPQELDECTRSRRRKGTSPFVFGWRIKQWVALGVSACAAAVIIPQTLQKHDLYRIAIGCGIGLLTLAGVMLYFAWRVEDATNPRKAEQARGKAAALSVAATQHGAVGALGSMMFIFAFVIWRKWPQPLLVLLLGFGTMVCGMVARERARTLGVGLTARAKEEHEKRMAKLAPIRDRLKQPREEEPPPPFTPPRSPPAATDFPGLIAYWSLDEGRGDRAFDSRKRLEAISHGGTWVTGIRGHALQMNGTSEYLDLGSPQELHFASKAEFTLACWVKTESKSGTVFWLRDSGRGLTLLGVQLFDGRPVGWIRNDRGVFHPNSFGGEVKGKHSIATGDWRHLVLTRDFRGGLELYLDGESVQYSSGGRETGGAITANTSALGVDLYALRERPTSKEVTFLKGCVDEFCVFNRALSAEEIAKLAGREP